MGHLDEFRRRLIVVSVALLITTILSFVFAQQLVEILAVPIGGLHKLESIDVTENINVFMRVALLGGVILSLPIILYEMIAFIVPGLTNTEKRALVFSLPIASILFLAGMAFAYFIVLPNTIPFLIGFLGIPTAPRPQTYFSFVSRLIFGIGLSFELPVIIAILARLGILDAPFLIKNFRFAIVLIAIIAAVITPTPDPLNMGLVMMPLVLLYGLGIISAKILYRPRN